MSDLLTLQAIDALSGGRKNNLCAYLRNLKTDDLPR